LTVTIYFNLNQVNSNLEEVMEIETYWDEEVSVDNDQRILALEQDIAESKTYLTQKNQEDSFLYLKTN
jgi:hypothetical protein